jgi:predicted signal transduction protein with EAL and GGDEF domain
VSIGVSIYPERSDRHGKHIEEARDCRGRGNSRELDFLTTAGCQEAQGYYFNAPMVAEQLAALLEARA